jgi:hypothetical protein
MPFHKLHPVCIGVEVLEQRQRHQETNRSDHVRKPSDEVLVLLVNEQEQNSANQGRISDYRQEMV